MEDPRDVAHGPGLGDREQEQSTELLPGAHEGLYQPDCGPEKHTPCWYLGLPSNTSYAPS